MNAIASKIKSAGYYSTNPTGHSTSVQNAVGDEIYNVAYIYMRPAVTMINIYMIRIMGICNI